MLHRITLSLWLIVLFAFTQIGAVTHEISHYNAPTQQTHQDQHTAPDQCSQCITVAHAASGVLANAVTPLSTLAQFQLISTYSVQTTSAHSVAYSARAPPHTLI
jgi:hypothetical protein